MSQTKKVWKSSGVSGGGSLLGVTDKESLEVQWRKAVCLVSQTKKVWKSSGGGSLLGVTDKESLEVQWCKWRR